VARQYSISNRVESLAPSGIRKFFDLIQSMEGVVSLGVGEPDFATPWPISEAAIHSIEKGHTHYTSNYGMLELRERLAQHLAARYGVAYDFHTQLLITVGVSEGVDLAMRAIINPGDEVLVPEPSYVSYKPCVVLAGGVVVPVATSQANAFKLTPADLEAKITPKTRALIISYPNNPTGAVMTKREMEAIAEVAKRRNLIVVSDEVYDRLVYGGHSHVCFASLPGMQERTIFLGGFSKSYAMTGWRVGFAAAPDDIIEAMVKIHQYTMLCAPTPGQTAALQALHTDDRLVENMVREYDRRRRVLLKGLNRIGLDCFEPQGAFYAFPSIKATGMRSNAFSEALLKEERVAVIPGSAFGEAGEGHVRCCYAVSLHEIEEALVRIERFVKRRRAK